MTATATAAERITDALRAAGKTVRQDKPNHWMAQCPAHTDGRPSLSITQIEGQVLLYCFALCANQDIVAALGLGMSDLFDNRKDFTDVYDDGRRVRRWYDRDGGKQFRQSGKTKGQPTLLRLGKVKQAVAKGETVVLVESEKDVRAIESLGVVATGSPMGATNFRLVDASPLHDAEIIAIAHDDEGGEKWTQQVLAALDGKAKSLDFAKPKVGNDAADHIAAGYTLAEIVPWVLPEDEPPKPERRFKIGTFANVKVRPSTYLLPGVLPDEELVVLVGEEGIGKGLFSVDCIARVTTAGHNVLIISTEDDPERALKPRLDVAGADVSRCIYMAVDPDTLQGQPHFPSDLLEVAEVIAQYNIRLVYIDPWVSSVSGGLRLRDTQDARRAIDPLISLARAAHCSILAVAHPNRMEGDLRARVGLTAVLRQAARILLYALEPPDDDTKLIVGIEKANNARRAPATVYRKVPRDHPELPKETVYAVEEITDELPLTIRQWHDRFRPDRDHRTTDRWPEVLAAADEYGLINRSDIVAIYTDSGSTPGAADKSINRWLTNGKLTKRSTGVYEVRQD